MKAYAATENWEAIKNYLDLLDEDLTTVDTVITVSYTHLFASTSKQARRIQESREELLLELDTKLALSNAATWIEV